MYTSVQFHLNNWCLIKICTVECKVEVWAKRGAGFVFYSVLGLILRADIVVQLNFVRTQRDANS